MIDGQNTDQELRLTLNTEEFRYLPLREAVYAVIKRAILEGHLAPGHRFTEEKLAEQLGVSRTPLREALRRLENEGFISVYIGRYAEVATIQHEELVEEYALREVIEGYAAKLAARHYTRDDIQTMSFHIQRMVDALEQDDMQAVVAANADFHMAIVEATKNRKIKEVMSALWKSMLMLSNSSLQNKNWANESIKQHYEILMAIEARDVELAGELAQEHIKRALRALSEG